MLMQTEVQYQAPVMMVAAVSTPRKLWEHPDPKSTAMWKFIQDANAKRGLQMQVCFACGLGDTERGACLREASCASGMLLFSQEAFADGIRWQNLCFILGAHERKTIEHH